MSLSVPVFSDSKQQNRPEGSAPFNERNSMRKSTRNHVHSFAGFLKFQWLFPFLLILPLSCGKNTSQVQTPTSLVEVVQQGKSELFAVPFERYRENLQELPIGVFDSGIGGLTVLAEIVRLDEFNNETHQPGRDGHPDFESERFVYLGDQANMPYGDYPSAGKEEFLRELALKDAVFLLGTRYWPSAGAAGPRNDKPPVKAVVIACNTATAYGLEHIRAAFAQWKIPVYLVGVVEAGAKGAVQENSAAKGKAAVAVLATVGTCQSEGYVRATDKVFREAGVEPPLVIQQGCHGLASAVEGDAAYIVPQGVKPSAEYRGPAVGSTVAPIDTALIPQYAFEPQGILGDRNNPTSWKLNSVENYIRYHVATLVENHRRSGSREPIGTVILGCTHFPYRLQSIAASFARLRDFKAPDGTRPYRELVPEHIAFVDPSKLTAEELYQALAGTDILLGAGESPIIPTDEFYISVPNTAAPGVQLTEAGAFTHDYKYGRDPGKFDIEYVKRVPMSGENLSPEVRKSIRETMPWLWTRMVRFSAESPRCAGQPDTARLKEKE
jgi:glutamate racemase